MTPIGPCFTVGPKGYFSFEPNFSSLQTATLLGAISGFFDTSIVYDAEGRRWRAQGIESPYKRSWRTVLLANTVYNPRITVSVRWQEPKAYALAELKQAYSDAVDKDDDVLTQFVEAQELKRRISEAQSFAQLVDVYNGMGTDHDREDPT